MSTRRCCSALSQPLRTSRPRLSTAASRPFSSSRPSSNTTNAPPPPPNTSDVPPPSTPAIQSFASALRTRTTATASVPKSPYVAYGTTEKMYLSCCVAGDYTFTPPSSTTRLPIETPAGELLGYPLPGSWHTAYSLPPTFSTWAQLTFLHLHLLHLRIRQFPPDHAKAWSQHLLDHFFYAAEERMVALHEMQTRGVRTRYLKDLFEQWRGAEVSYDEGIVRGDAVLAAAVWRNVFQARGDVDARHLEEVVGWMRRAAKGLAGMTDVEFVGGRWKFGAPWEAGVRMGEAQGINKGFED